MSTAPAPERRKERPRLALAGLGLELGAAVAGFTLLGLWIDRRWETAPWAVVICAAIGLVGGLYNFVREAMKAAARDAERRREEERGGGR